MKHFNNIEADLFHVKQNKTNCLICNKEMVVKYPEVKDHFLTNHIFLLHECLNCSLIQTSPVPANIEEYYKSSNYLSHTENKVGLINKAYFFIRKINLKIKYNLIIKLVPKGSILDYGCGNGEFVKYMNSKGFTTTGFEPDEEARKLANAKGGVFVLNQSELDGFTKQQDIITLWHVLEHVDNPIELLKSLNHKTSNNGHLIIAVPNYKSFDANFYGKYWAGYDVPRHLYHFSEKSITEIAKIAGWNLIKTKGMIFDSFYVSMLSDKYKNRSFRIGLFIGLLSNLFAFFNYKNYSSKIYIYVKNPK